MTIRHPVLAGLREGALTLAYNLIVLVRGRVRRLVRPTEMGVRVLAVRGAEVLLVRHRGGLTPWGLPGGGVGRREALAVAARRELREEAGCPAEITQLFGLYHSLHEGMSNHVVVFVADPHGPAQPPRANLEIIDARFFPLADLPAGTDPGSRRRIAEFVRGERGVIGTW